MDGGVGSQRGGGDVATLLMVGCRMVAMVGGRGHVRLIFWADLEVPALKFKAFVADLNQEKLDEFVCR
ncbi:hypothetical protein NL676_010085 [Syzygium grande]|nr:hypothetical protein NL676_010085 [Syzygium grande]